MPCSTQPNPATLKKNVSVIQAYYSDLADTQYIDVWKARDLLAETGCPFSKRQSTSAQFFARYGKESVKVDSFVL